MRCDAGGAAPGPAGGPDRGPGRLEDWAAELSSWLGALGMVRWLAG